MYFRGCGLQKTYLDKCLKMPVTENPLRANMLQDPKTLLKCASQLFCHIFNHSYAD